MTNSIWLMWVILAAVFIVAEILTTGFFIFWFGVGALAAALIAFFGLSGVWQWGVFVSVSAALVAGSRVFADLINRGHPQGVGADRYVGKEGAVIEGIDDLKNAGRVRVEEDDWRAKSQNGENISVGDKIRVVGVDGTRLIVKKEEK